MRWRDEMTGRGGRATYLSREISSGFKVPHTRQRQSSGQMVREQQIQSPESRYVSTGETHKTVVIR